MAAATLISRLQRSAWAVLASWPLVTAASPAMAEGALEALATAAEAVCAGPAAGAGAMAAELRAEIVEERQFGPQDAPVRLQIRLRDSEGSEFLVTVDSPGGVLRRLVMEHHAAHAGRPRPSAMVLLAGDCTVRNARRIVYDVEDRAEALLQFGIDLAPLGPPEPLNPPMPSVPEGTPSHGIVVALFDSGLAYTLPEIAARLAYGLDGEALGHDFWDLDGRPYDVDASRSAFFPVHHGTPVASVLLREAPDARVAPFRYPRPDMTRMGDMVAAAAEAGARIVSMPMGSNDPRDWTAFAEAARAHPDLLFVLSAGNNGRDIDREPLWPAELKLENAIVVTSCEDNGDLAYGSNWGVRTVDIMVPAEHVEVIDYRGRPGHGAGTSYAVPRVAALAARILERQPDLTTAELKTAVLEMAVPPPDPRGPFTRHGWIADPASDD